ncbi:MAG: hypothetical protein AAFN11_08530 [Chloroflexota bacterium]
MNQRFLVYTGIAYSLIIGFAFVLNVFFGWQLGASMIATSVIYMIGASMLLPSAMKHVGNYEAQPNVWFPETDTRQTEIQRDELEGITKMTQREMPLYPIWALLVLGVVLMALGI